MSHIAKPPESSKIVRWPIPWPPGDPPYWVVEHLQPDVIVELARIKVEQERNMLELEKGMLDAQIRALDKMTKVLAK